MVKRIYELNNKENLTAIYLDQDKLDFLLLSESKKLEIEFALNFYIESRNKSIFKNRNIINTNIGTILVSNNVRNFFELEIGDYIQYIPSIINLGGEYTLDSFYLVNTLYNELIIDESKSQKIYIDDSTYFLSNSNIFTYPNALSNVGIGRDLNLSNSFNLFFSDKLVDKLEKTDLINGFIFA